MHTSLPRVLEIDYVHALKRLEAHLDGRTLHKWCLFAGTGISAHLAELASTYLADTYNIALPQATELLCEKNIPKQTFGMAAHPSVPVISGDAHELSKSSIDVNQKTNQKHHILPPCDILDGGVPCISRTSLSMHASKNVNCCQKEEGETGQGYVAWRGAIGTHKPAVAMGECVPGLLQYDLTYSKINDAEHIKNELNLKSYWAHYASPDAEDYGSWIARIRLWWGAIRGLIGKDEDITAFFMSLVNGFKVKPIKFPSGRFITNNRKMRRAEALSLGLPIWDEFGKRVPKRQKDSLDWKLDHLTLWTANGMSWPFDVDAFDSTSYINFSNCLPREAEALCVLDKLFAPMCDLEFLDVNPTLARVLAGVIDENSRPNEGHTPWKSKSPTQVGSGKLVCRYRLDPDEALEHAPHKFGIRVVEAYECMRMIGWADEWYTIFPSTFCWDLDRLEGLVNMAGNAYTAFHFLPWYLALLATWGKFLPDSSAPPPPASAPADAYDAEMWDDIPDSPA